MEDNQKDVFLRPDPQVNTGKLTWLMVKGKKEEKSNVKPVRMGVNSFDERALVSNPVWTKEGSKSDHCVSPGLQPTCHLMAQLILLCAYS